MSELANQAWMERIGHLMSGLDDSARQDIEDLLAENDLTGAMYMAERLNQVRYQEDIDAYDVTREETV